MSTRMPCTACSTGARCWPTTSTPPTPSWPPSPGSTPRSHTARRRTPPSAAASSRSVATSRPGSEWRWAQMSVRGRASRFSRRGCRPTSCSGCSAARGCRSPRPTCSGSARPPGQTPSPWPTPSATCRWASSSTRSGCCQRPGTRSLSGSATPGLPTTRCPRCSPSAPPRTSVASGSAATRSPPVGGTAPAVHNSPLSSAAGADDFLVGREREEVGEVRVERALDEQAACRLPGGPGRLVVADGSQQTGILLLDDPVDELAGDGLTGVQGGAGGDPLPDLGPGDLGGSGILHEVVDGDGAVAVKPGLEVDDPDGDVGT